MALFNLGFFIFQSEFAQSTLSATFANISMEIPLSNNAGTALAGYPVLMLGIGCIFWNPVCIKLGKRPGLVAANAVFLVASMWNLYATSVHSLIGSRLLGAFGASAVQGLGAACISDISFLHERATKLGIYGYNVHPPY